MKFFNTFKKLLLLFIFCAISPLVAQTNELDESQQYHTQEFKKKHQIKEIHQYQYNVRGDSLPKTIRYYDRNGLLLNTIKYEIESGKLNVTRYVNTYNSDSLLVKTTGYAGAQSVNNISSLLKFEYNENGNKIACQSLDKKGKFSKPVKYEYDDQNRLVKIYNFGRKKYVLTRHNIYDSNGNIVKVKYYTISGNFMYALDYSYDKNNRLIACYVNGGLYFKNTWNIKNQLSEVNYTTSSLTTINGELSVDGNQKKYQYEYDDIGNLLSIKTFENKVLIEHVKYFYKTFEDGYSYTK